MLQLKQLMIVGIDCYHDTAAGKRSIGALVASLNQGMSRYVSLWPGGMHGHFPIRVCCQAKSVMAEADIMMNELTIKLMGHTSDFPGGSQSVCCRTVDRRSWTDSRWRCKACSVKSNTCYIKGIIKSSLPSVFL